MKRLLIEQGPAVQLSAAAGEGNRIPKFEGIAYTGGPMKPMGFTLPVWASLDGVKVMEGQRPVLKDHDPGKVVGHADQVSVDKQIGCRGLISGTGADAAEVRDNARNGFEWRLSVGAEVHNIEFFRAGETVQVNGQRAEGPCYVVWEMTLHEISFVALAGDDRTSATITARKGIPTMQFEDWLRARGFDPENVTDQQKKTLRAAFEAEQSQPPGGGADDQEADRQIEIESVCARFNYPCVVVAGKSVPLHQHAVEANLTPKQAELMAVRAARPAGGAAAGGRTPNSDDLLQAMILVGMGQDGVAVDEFGEHTAQRARDQRCRSVGDVAQRILAMHGEGTGLSRQEATATVMRASSTYSISDALANSATKVLLRQYLERPPIWERFCFVRQTDNFHDHTGHRVTETGALSKLGKNSELKHGSLADQKFTWKVDTYGKVIGIPRQDWINDDLGALMALTMSLSRNARRTLNDLVWSTLYAGIGGFFAAGNSNYFTGTPDYDLGVPALGTAIQTMRERRDAENNDLDIQPTTLVVGPKNEQNAKALMESEYIQRLAAGDSTAVETHPSGNPLRKALMHEVEPRISNTSKFSAADPDQWFVFGPKEDLPMVVAYLNGSVVPTIKLFGWDEDPDSLEVRMKIYQDFGAALGDPKPTYMADPNG